jgi:hypothetical protein
MDFRDHLFYPINEDLFLEMTPQEVQERQKSMINGHNAFKKWQDRGNPGSINMANATQSSTKNFMDGYGKLRRDFFKSGTTLRTPSITHAGY